MPHRRFHLAPARPLAPERRRRAWRVAHHGAQASAHAARRPSPCASSGIGLGIGLFLNSLDAVLFTGNFPFGVGPHPGMLFVGLREPSLGLRDNLAVREGALEASTLAAGHAR